ncbi:hypothetical protein RRG08_002679 [Elysia crispata]|uniref:Uncharacterized protein n=1 Tax=Elysia crispata TaxID=231223 RepID=A0AAE0XTY3_9GAST|nr:hypothetical protein RRG08_002679 [Elysia crispata]
MASFTNRWSGTVELSGQTAETVAGVELLSCQVKLLKQSLERNSGGELEDGQFQACICIILLWFTRVSGYSYITHGVWSSSLPLGLIHHNTPQLFLDALPASDGRSLHQARLSTQRCPTQKDPNLSPTGLKQRERQEL